MNASTTIASNSAFGLVAWLLNTRIHLPLIHIETRFRVMGDVVTVETDQVFEQTARESLDVTYTFPLPGDAAVYRCEMIVNDRLIRAAVMEQEEARRTVAEKKAAGHRTALVEMDRDNLFTLQLGNAAPGDRIVIRFAYFESLGRLGSQLSLRIPFSPGERYIPGKPLLRDNLGRGHMDDTDQVPDASRLTPPRIDRLHPDAATMHVQGLFDEAEVSLRTLSSPTHPVVVRPKGGHLEVELCGEEHFPSGDFVMRWEETKADGATIRAWTHTKGEDAYALLQMRAPEIDAVTASEDHAQDIYFLVDRSGSMEGQKWVKCAEALHAFVRELGSKDRVWITCFESNFQDFSHSLMCRDQLLAQRQFQRFEKLGTAGGTELLPALEHVLGVLKKQVEGNAARIVLITDGQVGNEPQILDRMSRSDVAKVPVHCFGIDDAVNDAFLNSLARRTGGRCALMTPNDDIPAAVRRLALTLRRPVLTGLRLPEGLLNTEDSPDLLDLHAGEVTLVALRLARDQREIAIRGKLQDGRAWEQNVSLPATTGDGEGPRLLWARRRCRHLLDASRRPEAIQLAIAHNVVCEGASFVAWDDSEKVPVAQREVYQPSMDTMYQCWSAGPMGKAAALPASAARMKRSRVTFQYPALDEPIMENALAESAVPEPCAAMASGPPTTQLDSEPLGSGGSFGPESPRETLAEQVLDKYRTRGEFWHGDRLSDWSHALYVQLANAGTSHLVAMAIAAALRSWGLQIFSRKRQRMLEELLSDVLGSEQAMETVTAFIRKNVRGPERTDLEALFAEPANQPTAILQP